MQRTRPDRATCALYGLTNLRDARRWAHGSDRTVRYALAGMSTPIAVAAYTYDALPEVARAAVPPEEALTDL